MCGAAVRDSMWARLTKGCEGGERWRGEAVGRQRDVVEDMRWRNVRAVLLRGSAGTVERAPGSGLDRVLLHSNMAVVRDVWMCRWVAASHARCLQVLWLAAIDAFPTLPRPGRLDSISRLDYVGLEGNRSRSAVQFQEESAGIAKHGAGLVAPP